MCQCFIILVGGKCFGTSSCPGPFRPVQQRGGVTAALVSSLFRDSVVPTAPFVCPEFGLEDRIHWPSLCAGLVIGLVLGQLIELFILLRQFLSARIRFYVGVSSHNLAVKNRLCG